MQRIKRGVDMLSVMAVRANRQIIDPITLTLVAILWGCAKWPIVSVVSSVVGEWPHWNVIWLRLAGDLRMPWLLIMCVVQTVTPLSALIVMYLARVWWRHRPPVCIVAITLAVGIEVAQCLWMVWASLMTMSNAQAWGISGSLVIGSLYGMHYLITPMYALTAMGMLGVVLAGSGWIARRARGGDPVATDAHGRCVRCGYDMTASPSSPCPECGPTSRPRSTRRR